VEGTHILLFPLSFSVSSSPTYPQHTLRRPPSFASAALLPPADTRSSKRLNLCGCFSVDRMKSTLLLVALASSALAQFDQNSKPFRLFIKSDNATLDGNSTSCLNQFPFWRRLSDKSKHWDLVTKVPRSRDYVPPPTPTTIPPFPMIPSIKRRSSIPRIQASMETHTACFSGI
jgi:hypothetical protein